MNPCRWVPSYFLMLFVLGCSGETSDSSGSVSFQDQVAVALEEPSADFRARRLAMIAQEQFEAQDSAGASETMRLARKACQEIRTEDHLTRADMFLFLGNAQHQIDKRLDARNSLKTAETDAVAIEDPMLRAKTLARIGQFQGTLGNVASGSKTLKRVEELLLQLKDDEETDAMGLILVLVEVSKGYENLGKAKEADRVLAEALEAANATSDARYRCDGIAAVAVTQHQLGRASAEAMFESALEAARAIEDIYSKAHALAEMAERFSAANKHAQAHAILNEADHVAHQIAEADLQHQTITKVRSLMDTLPKHGE